MGKMETDFVPVAEAGAPPRRAVKLPRVQPAQTSDDSGGAPARAHQ